MPGPKRWHWFDIDSDILVPSCRCRVVRDGGPAQKLDGREPTPEIKGLAVPTMDPVGRIQEFFKGGW